MIPDLEQCLGAWVVGSGCAFAPYASGQPGTAHLCTAHLYPIRASCLRLVTARAIELEEDWLTDRRNLNMALLLEAMGEAGRMAG